MKFNELHLLAFGHFTDVKLDLGGGEEGLHIIVGDNEAGKSTALDAIRNLLYGIDPRSRYDFVHKYSKMRVGATLRNGDGAMIRCVRRKGNKDTLRDGDDREALDESVLSSLLGGIDASSHCTHRLRDLAVEEVAALGPVDAGHGARGRVRAKIDRGGVEERFDGPREIEFLGT